MHKNSGETFDLSTPAYGKHKNSEYGYLVLSNRRILFFKIVLEDIEIEDITDDFIFIKEKNKRIYTIVDDGENISRTNDGFSALELLGMLEFTQKDIIDQIKGIIKPNKVTRNVVSD